MDFINYGYYIIEPISKPNYISLCCEDILTPSHCICNLHPLLAASFWDHHKNEQIKYQQTLRLSDEKFADMKKTVSILFNERKLDNDSRFIALSDMLSFYKNYLLRVPTLKLISIALEDIYRDCFFNEIRDTSNIFCPLNEQQFGGNLLGYDILGWDYGGFHTYLCNSLETKISAKFPLLVNKFGLIQNSYLEVKQFSEYIADMGEPVLWLPFAVWEYPIK